MYSEYPHLQITSICNSEYILIFYGILQQRQINPAPEKKRANYQKLLRQRRETSSCSFAPSCVPKQSAVSTNKWRVFN